MMFTEGLDENAVQWIRKGTESQLSARVGMPLPFTYGPEQIYTGLKPSKSWNLPPTQLNIHSLSVLDQLEDESVGSASGEAYHHEDAEDSLYSEEQESGHCSSGASRRPYAEMDDNFNTYVRKLPGFAPAFERESMNHLQGPQVEAREILKQFQDTANGYEARGKSTSYYNAGDDSESSEDEESPNDSGSCRNHVAGPVLESQTGNYYPSSNDYSVRVQRGDPNENPCISGGQPRPLSGSMGVPPSAPPMVNSFVNDNNGEVESANTTQSKEPTIKLASNFKAEQVCSSHIQTKHQIRLDSGVAGNSVRQPSVPLNEPPAVHFSGAGAWHTVIAYDACVRLCLRAWARGCMEAPEFLRDECLILRNFFGLQQVLLQPCEEITRRPVADQKEPNAASMPKRNVGKIKVQVRKVKIMLKMPSGCSFTNHQHVKFSNIRSTLLAGWAAVKKLRVLPHQVGHSNTQRGAAYIQAGAQYLRQVSGLLKAGVNTLRNTSMMEASQDFYLCTLKLKSTSDEDIVNVHPGSGQMHVFHPESPNDDLIVEIEDAKGNSVGRIFVQLASLGDDPNDRVRWWSVYNEPEHEFVGKAQLFINYTINSGEINTNNKWGRVGETLAYDIVLEVAMRAHNFRKRNLGLDGPWKWLLSEFALYYGVSDAYTKLRYLSCIMEVATPTEDCLVLIYDFLCPVIKARDENLLNRQEKRILVDVEDQVEQLIALVFENYKSLDDSSPSGITDVFAPTVSQAAPALVPAVQIFTLLHDILSSEAQMTLRGFFQTAAKKRCRRHLAETDEYVSSNNDGFLMDPVIISTAYLKMKSSCMRIRQEVQQDIDIHSQHILPSSIDLPNIAAAIYSVELCSRLKSFLVAFPPSSPSPPVADLLLATADFQRDLTSWKINTIDGGVDAKDLFHLYIVLWIQDKRLYLLEFCKLDKVRWSGVTTQHGTSPFVEEMYERIKEMLNEFEVIVNRWPEYTFALETAVADVETAIIAALEKQYADVLLPLKDVMVPKKLSLQYMQKLTRRRSLSLYSVPNQLGVFLNSIKRLLDTLRPKMEMQMKSWVACLPVEAGDKVGFGERLNEVTVLMRAKYKNFIQAIVVKLAENARLQRTTKLKKILQDTREAGGEAEIRDRMQLLNTQLTDTINHLHDVFTTRVFVAICRGYWDRIGQDVLHFLENRKENKSWYKGACFALALLDDIFASYMQRLQGHVLQEKDLEPPRSIMEARTMLSKDISNGLDASNYYYF